MTPKNEAIHTCLGRARFAPSAFFAAKNPLPHSNAQN
jgi:hypothetical protein